MERRGEVLYPRLRIRIVGGRLSRCWEARVLMSEDLDDYFPAAKCESWTDALRFGLRELEYHIRKLKTRQDYRALRAEGHGW